MKKMNSILFLLTEEDINKSSLLEAIQLARNNDARIKFLKIYSSYSAISASINVTTHEAIKLFQERLEESIECFSNELSGLVYTCDIREGVWFSQAIREAIELESDLIIISEPQQPEAIFASEAMHIIRKSPIPVWLIRAKKASTELKKILVPVSCDMNDKVKGQVNAKCMSIAEKLMMSSNQACELNIIHCWHLYNEWYLRNVASNISAIQIEDRINRERIYHEEWFQAFCNKYNGMNIAQTFLVHGEPEILVPEICLQENIDTLVMGTVNDVSVKGLYITSRAETILGRISCSVLTVKPDNFISPVL